MKEGMDRRDFLKYTLATGAVLAAGDGLMGSLKAMASIKIAEAEKVTIWILADNYYDALRPDSKIAKRYMALPGKSIHAEHGLSYYVETLVGGKVSGCMFDYGLDPIGVLNNIALLGLDVGKSSAFGLSHGHFDHYTGAVRILRQVNVKIPKGTPFYVGEECFAERYVVLPGGTIHSLGELRRLDIEAFGLKVVEVKDAVQIIPGAFLTGKIEQVTSYEKTPPYLLIRRSDKPGPDDFRGEQALFFAVKGKGLVVLSGCAHRGIVNAVKQAQKVAGIDKIHAVLGGFHLIGAKPEVIESTVADIKAMNPDYIVPTHCTGFEAIVAFRKEMPKQFTLNTAATRYTFSA